MLDHVTLKVTNLKRSKKFYSAALEPLGYAVVMDFPEACGFGAEGKADFWIAQAESTTPTHVAFASPTRQRVHAFHEAALKAGGSDNGPPGVRAEYHPHYFGAFVYDPDNHNIEAVVHKAE